MKGTGKTAAALSALPDGSIYIVGFAADIRYCRRLLAHLGRSPDCLHIISLGQLPGRARGYPRSTILDVDHAVFEWGMATANQRNWLKILQQRHTLPPPFSVLHKNSTPDREPNRPDMPLR